MEWNGTEWNEMDQASKQAIMSLTLPILLQISVFFELLSLAAVQITDRSFILIEHSVILFRNERRWKQFRSHGKPGPLTDQGVLQQSFGDICEILSDSKCSPNDLSNLKTGRHMMLNNGKALGKCRGPGGTSLNILSQALPTCAHKLRFGCIPSGRSCS